MPHRTSRANEQKGLLTSHQCPLNSHHKLLFFFFFFYPSKYYSLFNHSKTQATETLPLISLSELAKMAMEMAIRASANINPKPHFSPPLSPSPKTFLKPQFRPSSVSFPASTTITLLGLFTPLHEAKALTLPKDQITSSLTEVSLIH